MALILDGTDGITSSGGTNVLQDASVEMSNLNATGNPGAGNFLRGDGAWETAGGVANVQTFDANGTWNKPASGSMARIQVWGGGGGGAKQQGTNACTGGGGAGYNEIYIALSSLGATESVTIASGGIGGSSAGFNGGVGGTTTFGSLISAFGGGGGTSGSANIMYAGGGGPMSAGQAVVGAFGSGTDLLGYGDPKPLFVVSSLLEIHAAFQTIWHGGPASSSNQVGTRNGSPSLFGGAGGGSAAGTNNRTGGVSLYGGNGGNGGRSTTGIDGVQPGGGGGGRNNNLDAGNGGAGRVIVTVW